VIKPSAIKHTFENNSLAGLVLQESKNLPTEQTESAYRLRGEGYRHLGVHDEKSAPMSAAHSVIPGLLLLGFASVVHVLFPYAASTIAGWLVGLGALIIQL
jgi:hypothetical protein